MLHASMQGNPAFGAFGAAKRNPGVQQLQTALRQLGTAARDSTLMRVVADGIIGPATAAAVNRAFTVHIGPGQAPAGYRTGALTAAAIVAQASALAQLVQREAARRIEKAENTGPGHFGPSPALTPQQKREIAANPTARTGAGHFISPTPLALQQALNTLSTEVRDNSIRVVADGKIGPATVKAVNRAFTVHIGAGQSPAGYRSGRLTAKDVLAQSGALAQLVQREAARRVEVRSNSGAGYFNPQLTPQQKREIAANPTARTGAGHFISPTPLGLQQALNTLSTEVRDNSIRVVADGKIGPATTRAVNRAFTVHIGPGQAAASYRTGKLSTKEILAQSGALAQLVQREAVRRVEMRSNRGPGYFNPPGSGGGTQVPSGGYGPPVSASPASVRVLQTRLGQLGRVKRDAKLMITADGKVGPKTIAAVNRAFTAYVTSAPAQLRTGRLTAQDVLMSAASLTEYVGQSLRDSGTTPATAPPSSEIEPGGEQGPPGGAVTDETAHPDEGGMPEPAPAPVPSYEPTSAAPPPPPPPPQRALAPYSPGAPEGGGEGGPVSPTEAGFMPEGAANVPWVPIAIGVGVAAAAVAVVVIMNKNKDGAQPRRTYRRRR